MISLRDIETAVCGQWKITSDSLRARYRTRHYTVPRQAFMFLAREYTRSSYPRIGTFLCRDHTTVIHGERITKVLMAEDEAFAKEVNSCRETLAEILRWKQMAAVMRAHSFSKMAAVGFLETSFGSGENALDGSLPDHSEAA